MVDNFSQQKCRVIEPVTTVNFLWYKNIDAMQRKPENFQRREEINASFLDGWVAQRIDYIDREGRLVMVQEPFYMTYP